MVWSSLRISSLQMNMFNRNYIEQSTHQLQIAGQEVSTGRRADIFGDIGPRAAATLKLRTSESETQAYLKSNGFLGNKLSAMLTSVDAARSRVQSVLNISLANATSPGNGAATLQNEAKAAMESIVATLNISFHGDHVFAGTRSSEVPLVRWNETNSDTGLSPEMVLAAIVTGNPVDATQAQAFIDEIEAAFQSQSATNSDWNFEETFYRGTPEQASGGGASERVKAVISPGQELEYGFRANESAFRDVLMGLAMLSTADVSTFGDEAAYQAWMAEVVDKLSSGVDGMLDISARVGFNQQVVETASLRLTDISLVQRSQIGDYENVDPYEAVTRMTNLETQLQASYEVAARFSRLSLLNHL